MTERLDLFPTTILKARVPDPEALNAALLAAIDQQREAGRGIDRSNIGGWHSETDMAQWGGEAARGLARFAVETVSPHMADIAAGGKRQFDWGIDMWANVNGPGAANQLHCHPGAFWSGAYYVDAGGADVEDHGGELLLEDPRYPMAYSTVPDMVLRDADKKPVQSQFAVRPEAGMLVLFPSWLRHSVRPHGGDRERVSVAINLSLFPAMPEAPPT
ncbi:MAG: 2OG-Fe(II) oxygenase family protein [Woeseiaceae bacterium]|nr:2OG-Fe(II) oxygenase family protein [Woeseiaceae bacterium]